MNTHIDWTVRHWRSQDFVLRGPENRDAEGVEGNGERYPLPIRLGGLGERRKLPSGRKRILVHFELEKKTNLIMTNLIFFVIFIAHI